MVVAASELLSMAALSASYRSPMTPSRLRSAITETVVSRTEAGWDDEYVDWSGWANMFTIHPYLGYVFDEDFEYEPRLDVGGPDAVNYGFSLAEYGVFFDPDPRTLVAVVTGGSVAFNVGRRYGDHIRDVVADGLREDYDRVIVVNAAIPGHHQPQQLLLINYLLTLGAHFDVVINLDGFNEIALSPEENLSKGVASYFPYAWYFKIADFGAESRVEVAKMALLERRRRALAGFFTRTPWRWSSTAGAVWWVLDRSAVRRMAAIDAGLVEQRESGQERYVVTGPRHRYADRTAVQQHAAEIWYRSSILLHDSCTSVGARYYHFLQPNQYVADSKPMTHDERISVVHWELAISVYARDGYPLLIAYGPQLRHRGVSFHDLTMLFSNTLEPTYGDDCCHLNSLGDQMVAQAIGDAIVADFRGGRGEEAN
jgi:hypothetical protein